MAIIPLNGVSKYNKEMKYRKITENSVNTGQGASI
jgi:hypothetical protein